MPRNNNEQTYDSIGELDNEVTEQPREKLSGYRRKKADKQRLAAIRLRKKGKKFVLKNSETIKLPTQSEPAQNEIVPEPVVEKQPEPVVEKKTEPYTITSEDGKNHTVSIPDFYKLRDSMIRNKEISDHVRSEMFKIFRAAGIMDGEVVYDLVGNTIRSLTPALSTFLDSEKTTYMRKAAASSFGNAYIEVAKTELAKKERIIAAQKIANLMLNLYSPVAFVDDQLNDYADNYVIKDEDLLKEQLGKYGIFSKEELESTLQDIKAELPNIPGHKHFDTWGYYRSATAVAPEEPQKEEQPAPVENKEEIPEPVETIEEEPAQPYEPEPLYTITTEGGKTKVFVPDFYMRRDSKINENQSYYVREELNKIFTAAGVETRKLHSLVSKTMNSIIPTPTVSHEGGKTVDMHEAAVSSYRKAYLSVNDPAVNPKNRAFVAQRISDFALKMYSPVSMVNGELDHFADNYVIKDSALLRQMLSNYDNFTEEEIEQTLGRVDAAIAGTLQFDEQPVQEPVNEQPEPVNEQPVQEPVKEEPTEPVEEKQSEPVQTEIVNEPVEEKQPEQEPVKEQPTEPEVETQPEPEAPKEMDFNERLERRIGEDAVTESVRSELTAILNGAGVDDPDAVAEVVNLIQQDVPRIMLDNPDLDGENSEMRDVAAQFFGDSFGLIGMADLNTADRIITAQKVADVMLKNYSPIAFANGKDTFYSNRYVLKDRALLKQQLDKYENFSAEEFENLMKDVRATLWGNNTSRSAPKQEPVPKQEPAPKQEPVPKQEPEPEQEPVPEQQPALEQEQIGRAHV